MYSQVISDRPIVYYSLCFTDVYSYQGSILGVYIIKKFQAMEKSPKLRS